jgi:hypothetical protein
LRMSENGSAVIPGLWRKLCGFSSIHSPEAWAYVVEGREGKRCEIWKAKRQL